jgi:hypothetical protein
MWPSPMGPSMNTQYNQCMGGGGMELVDNAEKNLLLQGGRGILTP